MNAENPDTDEEIGLTEEEIKEIIGNDNLEINNLELPDNSPDLEESLDVEVEDKKNLNHLIEEIDLSDLDKEVATIDLSQEDTEKENFEDALKIDDSHFHLEEKETTPPPAKKSPPVKTKPKPVKPPAISKTPMKKTAKKNTKPIQTVASNPASTTKKPTTKPTVIHKANQVSVHAKSKKPAPAQTGIGYNTQQMKSLFLLLDEMLSQLPQEKIKKFAFTPEYEYYLTLLKKLGI